jgi:hypothetical protein
VPSYIGTTLTLLSFNPLLLRCYNAKKITYSIGDERVLLGSFITSFILSELRLVTAKYQARRSDMAEPHHVTRSPQEWAGPTRVWVSAPMRRSLMTASFKWASEHREFLTGEHSKYIEHHQCTFFCTSYLSYQYNLVTLNTFEHITRRDLHPRSRLRNILLCQHKPSTTGLSLGNTHDRHTPQQSEAFKRITHEVEEEKFYLYNKLTVELKVI